MIRTAEDVGIIVLLDDRFQQYSYRRLFPREWEQVQPVTVDTVAKRWWSASGMPGCMQGMIFNVIRELISDMTIHITTYDTCVYVDKSVDFVDYLWFYTEKTTDGSKMVYNSKRTVVDKKTNGTGSVNERYGD